MPHLTVFLIDAVGLSLIIWSCLSVHSSLGFVPKSYLNPWDLKLLTLNVIARGPLGGYCWDLKSYSVCFLVCGTTICIQSCSKPLQFDFQCVCPCSSACACCHVFAFGLALFWRTLLSSHPPILVVSSTCPRGWWWCFLIQWLIILLNYYYYYLN